MTKENRALLENQLSNKISQLKTDIFKLWDADSQRLNGQVFENAILALKHFQEFIEKGTFPQYK